MNSIVKIFLLSFLVGPLSLAEVKTHEYVLVPYETNKNCSFTNLAVTYDSDKNVISWGDVIYGVDIVFMDYYFENVNQGEYEENYVSSDGVEHSKKVIIKNNLETLYVGPQVFTGTVKFKDNQMVKDIKMTFAGNTMKVEEQETKVSVGQYCDYEKKNPTLLYSCTIQGGAEEETIEINMTQNKAAYFDNDSWTEMALVSESPSKTLFEGLSDAGAVVKLTLDHTEFSTGSNAVFEYDDQTDSANCSVMDPSENGKYFEIKNF